MMNSERYKVRGRRIDNGELVEGLLTIGREGEAWIVDDDDFVETKSCGIEELRCFRYSAVDPETVEPVPIAVVERNPNNERPHIRCLCCPNCRKVVATAFDEAPKLPNYCPDCGQRLDEEGTI